MKTFSQVVLSRIVAFQYNFCFESSLVTQGQSVRKSMCTVCVHTLHSALLQITYSKLSPRRTPLGPAQSVRLREMSIL